MSVRNFLFRFWNRVRNWFARPFSRSVPVSGRGLVSEAAVPVSEVVPLPSVALRRILLLVSDLKPYRRRNPSVRCLSVSGFFDAYRFLLRLGGCDGLTVCRVGGSLRYRTVLPDAAGTLELIGQTLVSDRRIVAVLHLDLPGSGCPVTEIRFFVRRKNRFE